MNGLIRKAEIADIEDLLQLYNEATLKLINQGINQWSYPWDEETMADLLPQLVVLENNRQLIGAMVISEKAHFNTYSFGKPALFLEKIVIHPRMQGKKISGQLFDFARVQGELVKKAVYFDCWAGNEKLITYYLNYAKQIAVIDEEDYEVALFQLY
ncbi:GNAT family N-acetyltransferase [Enterococcus sp. BWR-S5]|uniref:GNAT family N-acetyltransferase n=1 Tax=Enterococcus sp. BWR-S5 TaxID=2787714 RepID=UPI001921936A|nr:GNAT family N-acetyltransferase [Enterococcus sp. BWR-S5]MBL1226327.1 hypothetical protein [Enterococcus sp. BWR-S5]